MAEIAVICCQSVLCYNAAGLFEHSTFYSTVDVYTPVIVDMMQHCCVLRQHAHHAVEKLMGCLIDAQQFNGQ